MLIRKYKVEEHEYQGVRYAVSKVTTLYRNGESVYRRFEILSGVHRGTSYGGGEMKKKKIHAYARAVIGACAC